MVTIRNKFLLMAAGFWFAGLLLVLLGAASKDSGGEYTSLLLTIGVTAQAIGFGFLGYVIMQAVFNKKK